MKFGNIQPCAKRVTIWNVGLNFYEWETHKYGGNPFQVLKNILSNMRFYLQAAMRYLSCEASYINNSATFRGVNKFESAKQMFAMTKMILYRYRRSA